jgi:hypothetical protein
MEGVLMIPLCILSVGVDDLIPCKVNITDFGSLKTINEGNIPGEKLNTFLQLSDVFTDRPELRRLHIIVQQPNGECKCLSTSADG